MAKAKLARRDMGVVLVDSGTLLTGDAGDLLCNDDVGPEGAPYSSFLDALNDEHGIQVKHLVRNIGADRTSRRTR